MSIRTSILGSLRPSLVSLNGKIAGLSGFLTPSGPDVIGGLDRRRPSISGGSATISYTGGPSTVAWTPQLALSSSLMADFDASNVTTLALSGNQVTSWGSSVGSCVAAQATSSQQPTYSATARNGLPGIVFSGTNYLSLSEVYNFPGTTTASTIVVVGYGGTSTTTSNITAFSYGVGSTAADRILGYGNNSSGCWASFDGSLDQHSTTGWALNDRIIVWQVSAGGTNSQINVDGQLTGETATTGTAANTILARGCIGSLPTASISGAFTGVIQEILVFNRLLSDAERQSLEGYLALKWGLKSHLPGGHPYSASGPTISYSNTPAVVLVPSTPTVTVTPGFNRNVVTWTETDTSGVAITGHRIYRGTVAGSETLLGTSFYLTSWTDLTAVAGTQYFYRVSSLNIMGESQRSISTSSTALNVARAYDFHDSVGTNTHMEYTDGLFASGSNVLSCLNQLGMKHIRDYSKGQSNQGQGQYAYLASQGIKWCTFIQAGYFQVGQMSAIEQAYPGSIALIEGPNEVNNFSATDPSQAVAKNDHAAAQAYQAGVYATVRADPYLKNKPVISYTDYPYYGGQCDGGTFHSYPNDTKNPRSQVLSDLGKTTAFTKGTPLYITEGGYTTAMEATGSDSQIEGVDYPTFSIYMPMYYLTAFLLGVTRTYTYLLLDAYTSANPYTTSNDSENYFGLFDHSLTQKGTVVTNISNMLSLANDTGATAATFLPTSLSYSFDTPGFYCLPIQKSDGSYVLYVWSEVSIYSFANSTGTDLTPANQVVNLTLGVTRDLSQIDLGSMSSSSLGTSNSIAFNYAKGIKVFGVSATASVQTGGGGTTADQILYQGTGVTYQGAVVTEVLPAVGNPVLAITPLTKKTAAIVSLFNTPIPSFSVVGKTKKTTSALAGTSSQPPLVADQVAFNGAGITFQGVVVTEVSGGATVTVSAAAKKSVASLTTSYASPGATPSAIVSAKTKKDVVAQTVTAIPASNTVASTKKTTAVANIAAGEVASASASTKKVLGVVTIIDVPTNAMTYQGNYITFQGASVTEGS